MIFDFGDMCKIDIYIGNTIVQRMELPRIIAQAHFIQLVTQLRQESRPMKVVCMRDEEAESGRFITNSLSFENNTYIRSYGRQAG